MYVKGGQNTYGRGKMIKYILKRILMLIPVLIGVTFIVYFILALTPGDPVTIILGDQATEQSKEELREELGLNQPLLKRYADYMVGLLHGDMGKSYKNNLDVADQIMERFPNTAILALTAILIAMLVGVPVGIISAKHQNTILDRISMIFALTGISMPVFWLGLLLVIIFAVNLRILPSSGFDTSSIAAAARSLILPGIVLSVNSMATITRMTRSSMLEVMRKDYIDTARAKGVSERVVTFRHMLSNALIPIITVVGISFGNLLGGSIITETVFAWPGIGRFVVESIKMKDTPTVLGCVIFLSVMFSIVNLLIDILYAFVDPRIKSQYKLK